MSLRLIGKKRGMTQRFDDEGNVFACSVISIERNAIVQVKTKETDGYSAIQLGGEKKRQKLVKRPQKGHFTKAGVEPRRHLMESRLDSVEGYQVGQEIGVEAFQKGQMIDVMGVSKGKGFQGVMKLHGFAGGPASHGSGFHRHAGSTGMRTTPGRCLPGGPRASRMGGDRITVQGLEILAIDEEKGLLLVKGGIPGAPGGLVAISSAKKTRKTTQKK